MKIGCKEEKSGQHEKVPGEKRGYRARGIS